ncbi:hypothetical protein L1987_47331 [Smallanthus sonchifolius]|uniref:Uncharacterized protein n=1 Tax=Smallanthus sonchifolius TaxID=185202 RepID=A0ACB9G2S2_9ASTR|nr:hypothetical protein L1987_47331 [Smallanthus sonchifolius]
MSSFLKEYEHLKIQLEDIKSATDNFGENRVIGSGGFGKVYLGEVPHSKEKRMGAFKRTPGYCDPQYFNSYTLSKESDVYSFGVVLFEVLCGRLCCKYRNSHLEAVMVPVWEEAYQQKKLHEIVFQDLTRPMDSTSLETFSGIAVQCLKKSREQRPTMAHVVKKLEIALEFQKLTNKYEGLKYRSNKVDFRRVSDIEIMLMKVNMPLPDMMAAALAMDESILDSDQIENLIKFCPTKEEMELLKVMGQNMQVLVHVEVNQVGRSSQNYTGDKEMLGKLEQLSEFKKSLNTANRACNEVRNSVRLKEIMKQILYLGNALNQGTVRGSAVGFKLDSLLKLPDTHASNSKMTLMHYLCKVLASKSPALLDFHEDLFSLEPASKIPLKSLAEEMRAISKGLEKVEQELDASENDGPVSEVFLKVTVGGLGLVEIDDLEVEIGVFGGEEAI